MPKLEISVNFYKLKDKIVKKYLRDDINKFLEFFEKNYIVRNDMNWSCFSTEIKDLPLTTNMCDGWNRTINSLFRVSHPSIVQFINEVRKNDLIIGNKRRKALENSIFGKIIKKESKIKKAMQNVFKSRC